MPSNVEPTNRNHAPFSARAALLAVFASWLLLAVVRLTAPSDLLDNDQARPAMYALDILRNAHWIVQTDPSGDIASKPPLYTWLVAIVAAVSGRVNEWTLYIPTSLAVLGIALLVNRAASTRFGPVPGLLAAGAFLFSPFAAKHLALARTDALFALAVTGAALLAYRAWTTDRRGRWTLFWIACVLATLTKGPLGVVLALGGLVPLVWSDPKRVGRGVWLDLSAGIVIYAALCGGWLLAAHAQMGQPVIDKLIGRELLGHAASSDSGGMPLLSFYKPPLYFFSRFAPWCIPAAIGLFRVFAHPAADERQRMHERFLASWFLVGLAIFAIAPHQRADLLLPLIPAAAMLAGRELARWLDARPPAWPMKAFVACAAIATVLVAVDRHIVKRQDPIVQRTAEWKECARRIEALPGHPPLMDVGAPMALQMFLNLHQPRVSMESARIALQDDAPVVVAYSEPADERAPPLAREIATLPDPVRPKESRTRIVTNAPAPGK